jgi:hypothetical protein
LHIKQLLVSEYILLISDVAKQVHASKDYLCNIFGLQKADYFRGWNYPIVNLSLNKKEGDDRQNKGQAPLLWSTFIPEKSVQLYLDFLHEAGKERSVFSRVRFVVFFHYF